MSLNEGEVRNLGPSVVCQMLAWSLEFEIVGRGNGEDVELLTLDKS